MHHTETPPLALADLSTHLPTNLRTFDPVDLLIAVTGESVTLKGVTPPAVLPSWLPSADMLATQQGADPMRQSLSTRYGRKLAVGFGTILAALGLVALGFQYRIYQSPISSFLPWEVASISAEGLVISSLGHRETIRPGMLLPSGEQLISFDAEKNRYVTTKQQVTLASKK